MRRLTLILIAITINVAVLAGIAGAVVMRGPDRDDQRRVEVENRAIALERATRLYPSPDNKNFPIRKLLVEMTNREDLANHPWYTYIQGENGNTVGYYVTKTAPTNACNFLSGTEDIYHGDKSDVKMTAPSYDGIFYGGGGASGSCDVFVAQDYATGAIIKFKAPMYQSYDRPLAVSAKPIKLKTK